MQSIEDGYWPSPWPGEDGGPRRLQVPRTIGDAGRGLALQAGERLEAHSRHDFMFTMVLLRDPGEVFVLGNTIGDGSTSWVERIDPASLAAIDRSPDLPGGPFWPGGFAMHANGTIYVTYGRWCHRLLPDLSIVAARELPRERPHNSLLVLPDGHLVMKDFGGGTGANALPAEHRGSQLLVLEPDRLEIVDRLELDQGSIARLSASVDPDGDAFVFVVGEHDSMRVGWDGSAQRLHLEEPSVRRYRTLDGQTFGWDPVLTDDSAWFLDEGEGSNNFGPSFRGKGGASTAPLHLVRQRFDADAPQLLEVCAEPGGLIANPPVVDAQRRVAVGYDSAHGVMRAWRYSPDDDAAAEVWHRDQDHGGHMVLYQDTGELVTYDFDHEAGSEQVVVLDIESGAEKARVATGSPMQSVLFPSVGWSRDLYVTTFSTLSRITVS